MQLHANVSDPPILIVPGLGGSGEHHWQTLWQLSLPRAERVEQPDWDKPEFATWHARLTDEIIRHPGAILVGHSLGCALIAHVATSRPDLSIGGALLVAPADVESEQHTPASIRQFAPLPRHQFSVPAIVVASSDDPFMDIRRAREFALFWGAEFVSVGQCGHINVKSGFGPWPQGLDILSTLLDGASAPAHRTSAAS